MAPLGPAWRLLTERLVSVINVSLVIMHAILLPCHAAIIQLPLRQAFGRNVKPAGALKHVSGRASRSLDPRTQPLEGISGEGYYIDLNIGTPPQEMQVLVDTGSSNFALAASPHPHIEHYFNSSESSTYEESLSTIYVPYTQGDWEGVLGKDVVTLSSLPNVTVLSNIAFIHKSTGFFIPEADWQGIVGLAYQSIARPDSLVPFWDSLRDAAGLEDIFSLQLCGTAHLHNSSGQPAMEGNLVLGGVAEDMYRGDIFYSPIVKEMYYEVVITDMAVGGISLQLDCKEYNFDKTIVDSGTTHLRLPSYVFDKVVQAIKSVVKSQLVDEMEAMPLSTFWTGVDFLCWKDLSAAFDIFPDVSVSLVASEGPRQYFTLHLSAQHYLRSVKIDPDTNIMGFLDSVQTCLKFGISSSSSGTVLGALLMESFFVVFDRKNKRMGFAKTNCPPPYPEAGQIPVIGGLSNATGNLTACQYHRAISDDSSLLVVTYIMAGVCVLCALPLIIMVVHWQVRKLSARWRNTTPRDAESETVLTSSK